MRRGLFTPSSLISKAPPSLLPKCGACGLLHGCRNPKLKPAGEGKKRVLIVGEGPTVHDDASGRFLSSYNTDDPLWRALVELGVNINLDCWYTGATICANTGKESLREEMAEFCRPYLLDNVAALKPDVIIPLGPLALRSVIGHLWKEDIGGYARWMGWQIPSQKLNTWVCPTYGPDFVRGQRDGVAYRLFLRHLKEAFALSGRPWETVPDYASQVRVEMDTTAATEYLQWLLRKMERDGWRDYLAFDYETDRLKPDHPDAKIVACSVCYAGEYCLAFPWSNRTAWAMQQLIQTPVRKIAANYKFEERWTMAEFGHGVTNWHWDTMTAFHGLDPRPDIGSLKFQSFILLGQSVYNDHIHPFLSADYPNQPNNWKGIDLHQLLLYCGLDSMLEYHVAARQMDMFRRGQEDAN